MLVSNFYTRCHINANDKDSHVIKHVGILKHVFFCASAYNKPQSNHSVSNISYTNLKIFVFISLAHNSFSKHGKIIFFLIALSNFVKLKRFYQ